MAFLPERHRYDEPQEWRRLGRRTYSIGRPAQEEWWVRERVASRALWLIVPLAVVVFIVQDRDLIFPPSQDTRTAPPPAHETPAGRYAPVANWGNRNHTGVVPIDVFGFNRNGGR